MIYGTYASLISCYYCLSVDRKVQMNNKIAAGKTATIFQDGVDYTIKTDDRPYRYLLEDKTVLYLNLEQLRFMRSDYWSEKQKASYLSKCIVGSDKNGYKRCSKNCSNCKWYSTKFTNGGIVSLDELSDEYDYELMEHKEETEDIFKTSYAYERLYEAIKKLSSSDKEFINLKLKGMSETEIASKYNVSQRAIAKRRKRIFSIIYEEIKDLKQ